MLLAILCNPTPLQVSIRWPIAGTSGPAPSLISTKNIMNEWATGGGLPEPQRLLDKLEHVHE